MTFLTKVIYTIVYIQVNGVDLLKCLSGPFFASTVTEYKVIM